MSMPTEVVTQFVNTTAVNVNPTNTNNSSNNNNNNNNSNESNNKSDKQTTVQKNQKYNRLTRILRKPKSAAKPHPWRREKTRQKDANQSNNICTSTSANINSGIQAEEELQKCKQQRVGDHNDKEEQEIGFSLNRMRQLIHSLTPAQRERAMAGLDPLSQTQEALAQRAARFGLPLHSVKPQAEGVAIINDNENLANNSKRARVDVVCTPLDVSDETLQKREARFKTAEQVEMEMQLQRRAARFGINTANIDHSNTITNTQVTSGIGGSDGSHTRTISSVAGNTQTSEIKLSDADRAAMQARAKRFGM